MGEALTHATALAEEAALLIAEMQTVTDQLDTGESVDEPRMDALLLKGVAVSLATFPSIAVSLATIAECLSSAPLPVEIVNADAVPIEINSFPISPVAVRVATP